MSNPVSFEQEFPEEAQILVDIVAHNTAAIIPTKARKLAEQMKIGRNDPCPCSSGAKFKKCCLIGLVPIEIEQKVPKKFDKRTLAALMGFSAALNLR